MSSQTEKVLGDEAWKLGNFEKAIEHYTNAIQTESREGSDRSILKVLYSNRSAAYLKASKLNPSLLDAEKCVELDSQWPKGLIRKGDAFFALGRYTDAYNAYNNACRIAPNDSTAAEKRDRAQRAIGGSSSSSSSSSSSNATRTQAPGNILTSAQNYLRAVVVLGTLLYLLPLPLNATTSYKVALFSGLLSYVISLYRAYGLPKFNMEYAQLLIPDPTTMYAAMTVLLLTSRPYLTGLAPVFLTEGAHLAAHAAKYAEQQRPELLAKANEYIEKYLPRFLSSGTMTTEDWRRLSTASKWSQFNTKIVAMATQCEVLQGMFLLFEMILPTRNLLLTVMWWQYLQMRYMLDRTGGIQTTFRQFDVQITGLTSHRFCPSVIRDGYIMVRTMLAKQVQLPQPGQQSTGSSLLSKCTIM